VHVGAGALLVGVQAVAEVDARAQLEPERRRRRPDLECATDRVRGLVEDREEAVPGRVHQPPLVSLEAGADELVVLLEQLCPGTVAERDRQRR
jgi:hypothetical protein